MLEAIGVQSSNSIRSGGGIFDLAGFFRPLYFHLYILFGGCFLSLLLVHPV